MLFLIVVIALVASVSCVPTITSAPSVDFVVHKGSPHGVFCAASGNGNVNTSVQTSVCGAGFTDAVVGSASGMSSANWNTTLGDSYNCAQVRCQAVDVDGTTTSAPVTIVLEYDVGSVVDGVCSDQCDIVRIKATSNGTVTFTGFDVPRSEINFQLYHNGYNLTLDFNYQNITVSNVFGQGNDLTYNIPAGRFTYAMTNCTIDAQRFEMHGSTYLKGPNGRVKSATLFSVTDCVGISFNGVFPQAPIIRVKCP